MNDISPHHLQIIKAILRKHIPDREVWYFGSRATGKAKQYSDLDLAIIGTTPLTLTQLASLEYDRPVGSPLQGGCGRLGRNQRLLP